MEQRLNQDVKDIAKNLKKSLSRLERVKNEALKDLTPEQMAEISPISADFSRVMKATKNGNVDELNKYISKYANFNR
tara:strand:- start:207 stop:437 length:231 start_codon:yes stop_codon:yes gene_type:complete